VGLYLNPPDKALVLRVEKKSQVQRLERPNRCCHGFGLPRRSNQDYYRHGTTTLFTALDLLDGKGIPQCKPGHRHQEFLGLLNHLDQVPPGLDQNSSPRTMPLTNIKRSSPGWHVIRAITFITCPLTPAR
jgi:hypothetical protein